MNKKQEPEYNEKGYEVKRLVVWGIGKEHTEIERHVLPGTDKTVYSDERSYDETGKLMGSTSTNKTYDDKGNCLTESVRVHDIGSDGDTVVSSLWTDSFHWYDEQGNETKEVSLSKEFDHGKLVNAERRFFSYQYDANGNQKVVKREVVYETEVQQAKLKKRSKKSLRDLLAEKSMKLDEASAQERKALEKAGTLSKKEAKALHDAEQIARLNKRKEMLAQK